MSTPAELVVELHAFKGFVESRGATASRLQLPTARSFAAKVSMFSALTSEQADELCTLGDACLGEHASFFEAAIHERIAASMQASSMHTSKQGQLLEHLDQCFTASDLAKTGPCSTPLQREQMVVDVLKRCGVVKPHERTLGSAMACLASFEYDITFTLPSADDMYHCDYPRLLRQFPKDAEFPPHGQHKYNDDPFLWPIETFQAAYPDDNQPIANAVPRYATMRSQVALRGTSKLLSKNANMHGRGHSTPTRTSGMRALTDVRTPPPTLVFPKHRGREPSFPALSFSGSNQTTEDLQELKHRVDSALAALRPRESVADAPPPPQRVADQHLALGDGNAFKPPPPRTRPNVDRAREDLFGRSVEAAHARPAEVATTACANGTATEAAAPPPIHDAAMTMRNNSTTASYNEPTYITAPNADTAACAACGSIDDCACCDHCPENVTTAPPPPWRKPKPSDVLVPGTEAYEDHMVELVLTRERRQKEAAKQKAKDERAAKASVDKAVKGTKRPLEPLAVTRVKREIDGPTKGRCTLCWSDALSAHFELKGVRGSVSLPQTIKPSYSAEWSRFWFLARPGPGFHSVPFAFADYGGTDMARDACERFVASLKNAAVGGPPHRASHKLPSNPPKSAKAVTRAGGPPTHAMKSTPVMTKVEPKPTTGCSRGVGRGRGRGKSANTKRGRGGRGK
jgi:hypothetical protein